MFLTRNGYVSAERASEMLTVFPVQLLYAFLLIINLRFLFGDRRVSRNDLVFGILPL